jgi:hypothetical protein
MAPFPAPPHQTVRDVFRHTAFRPRSPAACSLPGGAPRNVRPRWPSRISILRLASCTRSRVRQITTASSAYRINSPTPRHLFCQIRSTSLRYTFASNGEITPPCGVPRLVTCMPSAPPGHAPWGCQEGDAAHPAWGYAPSAPVEVCTRLSATPRLLRRGSSRRRGLALAAR